MIFDFGDGGKRDLHDLAVRNLHFDAGSREGLRHLHAANRAAHPLAVDRNDLHIVLAVKWLQSGERLGYFHDYILPEAFQLRLIIAFTWQEVYRRPPNATGKQDLAYRNLSVYSSPNAKEQVSLLCLTIPKSQCLCRQVQNK